MEGINTIGCVSVCFVLIMASGPRLPLTLEHSWHSDKCLVSKVRNGNLQLIFYTFLSTLSLRAVLSSLFDTAGHQRNYCWICRPHL